MVGLRRFSRVGRARARRLVLSVLSAMLVLGQFVVPAFLEPTSADGLVESRQSNVASLPAAVDVNGNGVLDDYVTIVAPEGTTLTNVRALHIPSDNPPPYGSTFRTVSRVRSHGREPGRHGRRHLRTSR